MDKLAKGESVNCVKSEGLTYIFYKAPSCFNDVKWIHIRLFQAKNTTVSLSVLIQDLMRYVEPS